MNERNSLAKPAMPEEMEGAPRQNAPVDEARITAGIVELYREMLKEPLPEEWLRLVRNIDTKDRK